MAGLMTKYFVLSPLKDDAYGKASRAALAAYAKSIRHENPELANDLENWLDVLEPVRPPAFTPPRPTFKSAHVIANAVKPLLSEITRYYVHEVLPVCDTYDGSIEVADTISRAMFEVGIETSPVDVDALASSLTAKHGLPDSGTFRHILIGIGLQHSIAFSTAVQTWAFITGKRIDPDELQLNAA